MNYTFTLFLTHLLGQAPVLLTYLVGVVLTLVFRRQCRRPARLLLLALLLLLTTALVQSFLVTYLIQARMDLDWSYQKLSVIMAALGLIGSLIRAMALGLILAAVFIDRKVAQQRGSDQTLMANKVVGVAAERSVD